MKARGAGAAGDFFTGLVIFVISFAALIQTFRMPVYGEGLRAFLGAPGLTPGILSFGLIMMSGALMYRNRSFVGGRLSKEVVVGQWRVWLLFGISAAYVLIMPVIGFTISSFVALFSFQMIYGKKRSLRYTLWVAVLSSAVVAAALKLLFSRFFFVPLPGELL